MFEIRLFGTPSVQYKGQDWKIPRRATRNLLYILAAREGPIGRATLSALFWPDASEAKARGNLRGLLGKLRIALPDPTILITNSQSVALDQSLVSVDFQTFQKLIEGKGFIALSSPDRKTLPLSTYRSLVRAVSLWIEPGFLAGEDFSGSDELDKWLLETSHHVEGQYTEALTHLYEHELATGNLKRAIRWLKQALITDGGSENLHYLLLKTLMENGQRSEAQKHYEHLQLLSEKGEDFVTSARIRSVAEDIFQQPKSRPIVEPQKWPVHPSLAVPYIGQEPVFAQLERLYHTGGTVIVYGEAGAGKTRLVQEFFNRLAPHPRLLLASCHAYETDLPFYPWVELLRNHMTRKEWMQLPPVWASHVAVLIPELLSMRSDLQLPMPSGSYRARVNLFEAVRQALMLLVDGRPALLFLDDAHWADVSSLDLLAYLLEHSSFSISSELLVLAARVEESSPQLAKFLQAHSRQNLAELHLSHLSQGEVADMVYHILGVAAPDEFIERMTSDSGGNPFFILETMQAILDFPVEVPLNKLTELPVPKSIHQLIQNRLRNLSPDSLELIQTAAVLGNRFEAKVLNRTVTYSEQRFTESLDELQSMLLITGAQDSGYLEYTFVHEKIRESLLQGITSLRLRLLHRKAARALEGIFKKNTQEIAVILAYHYEKAGEFSQAFDYWVESANYAYMLTSIEESMKSFNRAKQLIPLAHHLEDEQIYRLYSDWSLIDTYLNNNVEAEFLNQELLEIGQERTSDLLIGAALDGLADAHFATNKFREGYDLAVRALPYMERAGNTYEIYNIRNHQNVHLYMLGNIREAKKQFYKLYDEFPEVRDHNLTNLYGNIHYQIGLVETLMGWPMVGLDFLLKTLGPEYKNLSLGEKVATYTGLGLAYYLAGDYKEGREASFKAINMGEQMVYKRMLGYAYAYCSLNEQELGHWDSAWQYAQNALSIGRAYGHYEITSLAYRSLGDICMRVRGFEQAAQMYNDGVTSGGEHFVALDNLYRLGFVQMLMGQESGQQIIEQVIETAGRLELGGISVFAEVLLAFAKIEKDPRSVDKEEIKRLHAEASNRSMQLPIRLVEMMCAVSDLSSGDFDSAIQWLEKVIQESAKMPCPSVEIRALRMLIPLLVDSGMPMDNHRDRLQKMVQNIDKQAQNLPINQAWQGFRPVLLGG